MMTTACHHIVVAVDHHPDHVATAPRLSSDFPSGPLPVDLAWMNRCVGREHLRIVPWSMDYLMISWSMSLLFNVVELE